jgi:hypothetical protein
MVKRYRGGVVSATEVETTAQSSSAVFNLTEAAQEKQAGSWPGSGITSVQMAITTTPFVAGYRFSSQTGFGTKYVDMNPANSSGNIVGLDYFADGNTLMVAQANNTAGSRRITAVNWNGEGGYGTFYTNPTGVAAATGTSYAPLWAKLNRATNHLLFAHGNSSANNTWRWMGWTPGEGWTNAGQAPSLGTSVNTSHIAITPYWVINSNGSSYYYKTYAWGTGGPGSLGAFSSTQYTLTSYTSTAFEGSPDGNVLVIANTNTAPGLHAWNMTGTSNGTPNFKYANPGTGTLIAPTSNGTIQWSVNSDMVAIGGGTSPYLEFYKWNKSPLTVGWGTKLSSPVTTPTSAVRAIRWTPDQGALITITANGPEAWTWSTTTGIGTKFSAPSTSPGTLTMATSNLAVSPN